MNRPYLYVGPPEIAAAADRNSARVKVTSAGDLRYLSDDPTNMVTVTFVVDTDGDLWIADRRSEHGACARGGPVLSAGEMTFQIDSDDVDAAHVTNQSTGYCPEPESWAAVATALEDAGISHGNDFDMRCEFRRCVCGQINIVKNGVYECGVCEAELPFDWNLGPAEGT